MMLALHDLVSHFPVVLELCLFYVALLLDLAIEFLPKQARCAVVSLADFFFQQRNSDWRGGSSVIVKIR